MVDALESGWFILLIKDCFQSKINIVEVSDPTIDINLLLPQMEKRVKGKGAHFLISRKRTGIANYYYTFCKHFAVIVWTYTPFNYSSLILQNLSVSSTSFFRIKNSLDFQYVSASDNKLQEAEPQFRFFPIVSSKSWFNILMRVFDFAFVFLVLDTLNSHLTNEDVIGTQRRNLQRRKEAIHKKSRKLPFEKNPSFLLSRGHLCNQRFPPHHRAYDLDRKRRR